MTFKEIVDSIVNGSKAKITKDSSTDEIERHNNLEKSMKGLTAEYDKVVDENSRLKQVIVDMHLGTGSKEEPKENPNDVTPMSIEDCFKQVLGEQKQ